MSHQFYVIIVRKDGKGYELCLALFNFLRFFVALFCLGTDALRSPVVSNTHIEEGL
jgi:hypothetical protein